MEQVEAGDESDGGPSRVVVAIAVVAVVAVLGLGAWLLTRSDDDDGALAPDTSGETTDSSDSASVSDSESAATEVGPSSSQPTTLSTETSTTSPPQPPPATAPPDTGPASIAPGITIPVSPTSSPVVDTMAPPTSGGTTVPDNTAPDSTVADPPTPRRQDDWTVGDLVPNVAAEAEYVGDADQLSALIDELLATPRHDVASATPVSTLCATVALREPARLGARWELDGRPLSSTDAVDVRPPGFGECVENDGDPLRDGAYQFVAVDSSGQLSAAGTFVAGAARIDQRLRNNGNVDICGVLIGPASASYYESFDVGNTPIEPGATLVVPVADVRQDLRPIDCNDAPLAEQGFDPSADEQNLVP